jgi:hypothetical protein
MTKQLTMEEIQLIWINHARFLLQHKPECPECKLLYEAEKALPISKETMDYYFEVRDEFVQVNSQCKRLAKENEELRRNIEVLEKEIERVRENARLDAEDPGRHHDERV